MSSGTKNSSADVELQDVQDGGIAAPAQPRRTSWSEHLKSSVPRLKLPLAILVGASITAGTTYALVKHIQHLIVTARVSSDPQIWIHKARDDGYGACYNGCEDCHDMDFAYNACQKTARAFVPGIDCNGTRMWNWLNRYPIECLEALGAIYKAEALTRKKQSYRNQLAVIILTILAGVIGAFVVYKLWSRWFPPAPPPVVEWPTAPPPYQPPVRPPRPRNRKQWPFFWRGAAAASFIGGSHAFPCWGYSSKADQYFINPNNTISGVVHGWTSNCYQESYICGQTCTTTNTGGGQDGGGGSTTTCTPDWCTRNVEDAAPKFYVNWSSRRVQGCGFQLVDNVEDEVSLRIANPLLEKNWRVKISVNQYNVTDVTDPSVMCLWDIGNH